MPVELMERVLGETELPSGKRPTALTPPRRALSRAKSMSTEETFEQDTIDVQRLQHILIAGQKKLCFRLRSEHKVLLRCRENTL